MNTQKDCLFCKIIKGDIPSKKAYEDERVYAFFDINPQAPVHILIIPKKHFSGLLDLDTADNELIGYIHGIAAKLAREHNIANRGFRIVTNSGSDAGQTVFHIHFHLIGGRPMNWPPG
ncbi:MAG: histidine triad nucleotide-binding protein [Candidatus Auribacterota bacterium]|jgi:histidine triad (HIT) family protein|uniref:Histidine triad nucleotide-binding protein n=1 Tax=Candidatus Auribacter fodinae TaxID=2093366 RepID=A0A3A4RI93_9BACT|nr:MAG: histidine triad nucleotide-binding protein [Candidatus Auribacter fodinae]